jgi:KUP system potassium uptake protein
MRANERVFNALVVYTTAWLLHRNKSVQPQTKIMTETTVTPHGAQMLANGNGEARPARNTFWPLTLGSIGVVYGDIGTSPLYALREAVNAAVGTGGTATSEAVLGVLSLILWALVVVVTLRMC